MVERPAIFSAWSIPKLLDGTKTNTRRLVKFSDGGLAHPRKDARWRVCNDGLWYPCVGEGAHLTPLGKGLRCPYGAPGDRIWVKETWAPADYLHGSEREEPQIVAYRSTCTMLDHGNEHPDQFPLDTYAIDFDKIKWKSPLFMPRWASRITLEVTGVRVERLHEISEEDARAEGIPVWDDPMQSFSPRVRFHALWDSINAKRAPWSSNPFVWVISFRRMP